MEPLRALVLSCLAQHYGTLREHFPDVFRQLQTVFAQAAHRR